MLDVFEQLENPFLYPWSLYAVSLHEEGMSCIVRRHSSLNYQS